MAQLLVRVHLPQPRKGSVNTYLQARKITIEQDYRSPLVETVHLIRKPRWIGMEEEAEQLQMQMRQSTKPTSGENQPMSSEKQYRRFAATSLGLSESLAGKTRMLIRGRSLACLAERSTPLVERESGEAHRIIGQPLSNVTSPRYQSAADQELGHKEIQCLVPWARRCGRANQGLELKKRTKRGRPFLVRSY
jgi:hypothetical protein